MLWHLHSSLALLGRVKSRIAIDTCNGLCWTQAVMTDELGQVRMQLQLEKEALERARSQRAADRSYVHSQHSALK